MQRRWTCLSFLCLQMSCSLVFILPVTLSQLSAAEGSAPATARQAAQVIDLSTLPRFGKEGVSRQESSVQVSYSTTGNIKSVYEFHQKQLLSTGWKALPQSSVTDQYASGTFNKYGFTLSLTVTPAGEGGKVSVALMNHGNVDLNQLPLPAGSKPLFAGPVSAMWTSSTPVEDAVNEVKAALAKQGWVPYGEAGGQHFFRQNAVRLSATMTAAPAQMGQTMIVYSSEQLSAELPAPSTAANLQYADINHQLGFDTAQSDLEVLDFYRQALAAAKWEATTDKPIKIDFRETVIFRNPEKDLIELQMHPVDGRLRVQLSWSSAAQVEELERRARAAIEARQMQKPASGKIPFTLPTAGQDVEISATRIEFKLATGTAKATAVSLRKDLEKAGWKLDEKRLELQDQIGLLTFIKGEQEILLQYVDPGFIPAEMTIQSVRGELDVQKAK